jgi:hypothetical protein
MPFMAVSQIIERIDFGKGQSNEDYYLAVMPKSKQVKSVLVLLSSFLSPEDVLPETKLHNVAYVNDMLTVFAYTKGKFFADSLTIHKISTILKDVINRYGADKSKFALSGFGDAGDIALRYTELTYQYPSEYPLQPKAVFGINTPVDLFGLWHLSDAQIKKNYWPGSVGDGHYYMDTMAKKIGSPFSNAERYKELTPFYRESNTTGNEVYLKDVAIRLYYDMDMDWQLSQRRNSLYDTYMPDGSELIKRLLLLGNNKAEFMVAREPGMKSNGIRHPNALSIVDEVDCIQWLKRSLDILDIITWVPPYKLDYPKGWSFERFEMPPEFAPKMSFKGVEELRFPPGWGDSTSGEHWSYAYLWWIKGTASVNTAAIEENLDALYSGLINRNILTRKIPLDKQVPTKINIKEVKKAPADLNTYNGTIHILNYITQTPIILNAIIHVRQCSLGHIVVLVEVSPKPYNNSIWAQLNQLIEDFNCYR